MTAWYSGGVDRLLAIPDIEMTLGHTSI